LAWLVNLIAGLLWAAVGVDVLTVVSAVSAYMFNVGAGSQRELDRITMVPFRR
jgi:hypothetical protein